MYVTDVKCGYVKSVATAYVDGNNILGLILMYLNLIGKSF